MQPAGLAAGGLTAPGRPPASRLSGAGGWRVDGRADASYGGVREAWMPAQIG